MSRHEVVDFCHTHYACADGRDWALNSCDSMHEVWLKARPDWVVWVATRQGVLPERDLRLFACWCARQVWHLLTDERSKNAVIVAEKYAVGEATTDELKAACAETWAAEAAAAEAALTAEACAEWSSAAAAAAEAAEACVEWSAAAAAAEWAACAWAAEEEEVAAKLAQAAYLRERFSPFLKEGKK